MFFICLFVSFGVSFCRGIIIITITIIILKKNKRKACFYGRTHCAGMPGVAGPKELPEAAALRTEPRPPTASGLCRRQTTCTREKRGPEGVLLTVPKDQPPLWTAPFASAPHIALGSPRRYVTTVPLYKQSPPTRRVNSFKKSLRRNSQCCNPGNVLGLFFSLSPF